MRLADRIIRRVTRRQPDFIIGGGHRPYLRRWWLTPWSGLYREIDDADLTHWQRFVRCLPSVYLHHFLRSDDDRALHDHPWANCSILLRNMYVEHTIAAGGVHRREVLLAGDVRVRWSGRQAHRVELVAGPCWTLFITGFKYRAWGFHCDKGWVPWKQFTASNDRGAIGRGCDQ